MINQSSIYNIDNQETYTYLSCTLNPFGEMRFVCCEKVFCFDHTNPRFTTISILFIVDYDNGLNSLRRFFSKKHGLSHSQFGFKLLTEYGYKFHDITTEQSD